MVIDLVEDTSPESLDSWHDFNQYFFLKMTFIPMAQPQFNFSSPYRRHMFPFSQSVLDNVLKICFDEFWILIFGYLPDLLNTEHSKHAFALIIHNNKCNFKGHWWSWIMYQWTPPGRMRAIVVGDIQYSLWRKKKQNNASLLKG